MLLPQKLANQKIYSKEEGNDNTLNEECLPDEVLDNFEIHGEAFNNELSLTEPRRSRWRKSDEVNPNNPEELQKLDKVLCMEIKVCCGDQVWLTHRPSCHTKFWSISQLFTLISLVVNHVSISFCFPDLV